MYAHANVGTWSDSPFKGKKSKEAPADGSHDRDRQLKRGQSMRHGTWKNMKNTNMKHGHENHIEATQAAITIKMRAGLEADTCSRSPGTQTIHAIVCFFDQRFNNASAQGTDITTSLSWKQLARRQGG